MAAIIGKSPLICTYEADSDGTRGNVTRRDERRERSSQGVTKRKEKLMISRRMSRCESNH